MSKQGEDQEPSAMTTGRGADTNNNDNIFRQIGTQTPTTMVTYAYR